MKGDGIKEGFETANAIQFTSAFAHHCGPVAHCPPLDEERSFVQQCTPFFPRWLNAPSLIPLSKKYEG